MSKSGAYVYDHCAEHQRDIHNAKPRDWDHTPGGRAARSAMNTRWRKLHPEVAAAGFARYREHKLGLPPFTNVSPWPFDWCMIHAGPIVGMPHKDHDPSLAWLSAHPDYDGPRLLGPTCAPCNLSAHAHGPTWSLAYAAS